MASFSDDVKLATQFSWFPSPGRHQPNSHTRAGSSFLMRVPLALGIAHPRQGCHRRSKLIIRHVHIDLCRRQRRMP